ncbi:MAG: tetratricopeptide repeat protein, partial [Waddliaceae bacterium]
SSIKNNIDLKSLYNQNGTDIHHYSPKGNRLLARTISRYLEKKSSSHPRRDVKSTGDKTSFLEAQANLNQGLAAWDLGQNEKAIKEFRKFLQVRPRHAEAHFLLGLAYKNLGQLDMAIREVQTSIQINPKKAISHNTLGELYLQTRDFQSAIGEFETTLGLSPSFSAAYFNLGLAFDGIKDGPNAAFNILVSRELFEHAKQDVLQHMAQEKLANILKKYGMNPDSLDKSSPGSKWGVALVNISILKKLLIDDPGNIGRHYRLGLFYLDLNKYKLAAEEFNKVIKIFPEAAEAFNNLGVAFMKMEKYQKAVKALQEAIHINKEFAAGHLNLGVAYDLLGDGRQAIIHTLSAERLFRESEGKNHEAKARSALKIFFRKYGYRREDFPEYVPNKENGL